MTPQANLRQDYCTKLSTVKSEGFNILCGHDMKTLHIVLDHLWQVRNSCSELVYLPVSDGPPLTGNTALFPLEFHPSFSGRAR